MKLAPLLGAEVYVESNYWESPEESPIPSQKLIYRVQNLTYPELVQTLRKFKCFKTQGGSFTSHPQVYGEVESYFRTVPSMRPSRRDLSQAIRSSTERIPAKADCLSQLLTPYSPSLSFRGEQHLPSHILFVDESSHNVGRFRSISAVKVSREYIDVINSRIRDVIPDISSLAYKKLRSDRVEEKTILLLNVIKPYIQNGSLRTQTLIWDIRDRRHDIQNRDDTANFKNLLRQITEDLGKEIKKYDRWSLFMHKGSPVDNGKFVDIADELNRYSSSAIVDKVEHCSENEHPILVIADIFAGLAVGFGNAKSFEAKSWQNRKRVAQELKSLLSELGINLSKTENRIFETQRNTMVSFWPYRPRRSSVTAPTKTLSH